MPRTTARPTRRPDRRVPLAEGATYSKLSIKTLRRYGAAGLITLYRAGPKLLQVDLDEIDSIIRPVPTAGRGDAA
jgi:hypothetical protein